MFIRIIKPEIEKTIECTGYDRRRYAHKEGEESKQLGLLDPVPGGWTTSSCIDIRGNPEVGTFVVAEEPGNSVFVMTNDGDTIDRIYW